jgi:hypothetical protein
MPKRILCNDVKQEGVKAGPDLASGFSTMYCYTKFALASERIQLEIIVDAYGPEEQA